MILLHLLDVKQEHAVAAALEIQPQERHFGEGFRERRLAVTHLDHQNAVGFQVPARLRQDANHYIQPRAARGQAEAGFVAIFLGSALTMKVQYYKLVYEEEASFGKALVASLADLHLLPNGLRKLDKV